MLTFLTSSIAQGWIDTVTPNHRSDGTLMISCLRVYMAKEVGAKPAKSIRLSLRKSLITKVQEAITREGARVYVKCSH